MELYGILIDKVKQMLAKTTQKGMQTVTCQIHRRYIVNHLNLPATRLS